MNQISTSQDFYSLTVKPICPYLHRLWDPLLKKLASFQDRNDADPGDVRSACKK
jgi:hypothetical protein